MHIKRIELQNFGYDKESGIVYEDTALDLPSSGLIFVTGENGSGKSLLFVEAVGQALWGKPVRKGGAMAWHPNATTSIYVETDIVNVRRSRKGAKTTLSWWEAGTSEDDADEYDTASKAQVPLTRRIGDFTAWSHSSVFSAASVHHFTHASSGDRQRYLEMLLHLTKFDEAAAKYKTKVSDAEKRLDKIQAELLTVAQQIRGEHQRVKDAEEALPLLSSEESSATPQTVAAEAAKIDRLDRRINTLLSGIRDTHGKGMTIRAQLSELKRRLDFLQREQCPTCGQEIAQEMRDRIQHECEEMQKDSEQRDKAAKAETDGYQSEIDALRIERKVFEDNKVQMKAEIRSAQTTAMAILAHKRVLESASSNIGSLEEKREEIEEKLEQEEAQLKLFKAVDAVVGLKGVRSHLLSETLHGIEAIGNEWLDKFCTSGKYRVQLSPFRENKKGGVVNGIDLQIEGVGGGHGYGSCSDGQRRRIDLALLFANAEIAASSAGHEPGTLIIDEAVDGLDKDGVAIFADIVRELASDRVVVVISHRPDLASVLSPDTHLRVENGNLVRM